MRGVRHLPESWEALKTDLAGRFLYLFFDYDGTLSSIVRDPEQAVLSVRMKRRLERLSGDGRCRIAVISGRSLEDIRNRVGIAGIVYGGNHGLEMEGPGVTFRYPVPEKMKCALDELCGQLGKALLLFPGAFVEDKGLTLAVHFRRVKRGALPAAMQTVLETARPYRLRGEIVLRSGKEVCEIRPSVEWDKGKTVLWLLEKVEEAVGEAPWPVCLGDDRTDEDAFRAIRNRGLTVFVGEPRETEAMYYLGSIGEVAEFLGRLARIRKG
ncbi:MAG: trehalose-phosphatase [Proteobacteria bacterium]|nr:trehalose-phosphatase [Pseudomonadota bacterium]MBU1965044.1 trehalose-phosphatase [Pseudomonadota bacterium]